ncbi:hypothetical protein [Bacillus thuringiensis]|uniref:hypothetical protein n=1 Tax=Bacillus thuringiensis TaxID=1428 RepID=UPI002FFDB53F
MYDSKKCIVCSSNAKSQRVGGGLHIKCPQCGEFGMVANTVRDVMDDSKVQRELAAIMLERRIKGKGSINICRDLSANNEEVLIEYPLVTLDELLKQFPKLVSEQMDRALMNIAGLSDFPGKNVSVQYERCHLLFTKSSSEAEVTFILTQLEQDGLIIFGASSVFYIEVKITAKGWNRVVELERNKENESKQAFVAMWFGEEMNSVYQKAIKRAIEDAGYNAMRIDELEHNNKIDDAIIAQIQRSKFVIADFTGHRGGVYFEAGYAMGLGIPVIWSCRKNDLDNLHFDTRQYSHLVWGTEQELYKLLLNRIKATIK